jgi:PhzF family phenazine biosynthesis protein
MKKLALFQVDSFTKEKFKGNPAGVCMLPEALHENMMQNIAAEMNLAETAFLFPMDYLNWNLRWFTPTTEVPLCGHATLAAAHILNEKQIWDGKDPLSFHTRSGVLVMRKIGGKIQMDFPSYRLDNPESAIHQKVKNTYPNAMEIIRAEGNLIISFTEEREIENFIPQMDLIKAWGQIGVIITSKGTKHDIVSRYFAPNVGVPEDPVTGSAHVALCNYWFPKLGLNEIKAFQKSQRGGELTLRQENDRVLILGEAITVFETIISI